MTILTFILFYIVDTYSWASYAITLFVMKEEKQTCSSFFFFLASDQLDSVCHWLYWLNESNTETFYVIYPLETHYSEYWHFGKGKLKKNEIITGTTSFPERETLYAQGQASCKLCVGGNYLTQFLRVQKPLVKHFWVTALRWDRIKSYGEEIFLQVFQQNL